MRRMVMTIEKRPNGTYRVKIRMRGPDGLHVNPPDRTSKRRRDAEEYECIAFPLKLS